MDKFLGDELRRQVEDTIQDAIWNTLPDRSELLYEGYSFKGFNNMDDNELWELFQELYDMSRLGETDLKIRIEAAKAEYEMLTAQKCLTVECE
jgi:hypothetical protein